MKKQLLLVALLSAGIINARGKKPTTQAVTVPQSLQSNPLLSANYRKLKDVLSILVTKQQNNQKVPAAMITQIEQKIQFLADMGGFTYKLTPEEQAAMNFNK